MKQATNEVGEDLTFVLASSRFCNCLIIFIDLSIINHKSIKMKQVKCADLGNDCDFVAKGTLDEVMAQVADHATGVHKMTITDDVVAAVKGVMTDV